ncbi:hypothetical protein [Arsenophonus nasoniae]|uniref:Phage transcriptional regulator n=1 Tax=Arsenophonus nasoniae TaxID=638 RepID=A0AA95KFQ4_9GAMM|nr:hypothetical protein [Arsenophonus nasoniae]WGM04104.1 hypothetical protein QE210_21835 [Arsenophonus nasoniae]
MATIQHQTRTKTSKFIDTYWIIHRNSNTPSSKVSFTRNDRRIFNVLFKDDRLIWDGRKPVMEGIA